MSQRRLQNVDLASLNIPDDCDQIVVVHNNTRITIRHREHVQRTSIENKQSMVQARLDEFFANPAHFARILPFLEQRSTLSLRLLDYACTNYAKKFNVFIDCHRNGERTRVNMYLDYKANLKAYSKRSFDPFCRRERIMKVFAADPQARPFITTTAQLCFFRWAVDGVIDYCEANADEIEVDMVKNLRVRSDGVRRSEISPAATAVLNREHRPSSVSLF